MNEQPTALRLADWLEDQYDPTHNQEEAAAELRRLHNINEKLSAALHRLISYCHTIENQLMEADGEHPALQEAKEALQRGQA